jgi:hypothetical protein
MNAAAISAGWSSLPLVVRFGIVFLAGYVLVQIVASLLVWFFIVAFVLGVVALVGLLYRSGRLPIPDAFRGLLDAYAGTPLKKNRTNSRNDAILRAEAKLETLAGLEPVKHSVRELRNRLEQSATSNVWGLGMATPVVVIVIDGPSGSGRRTLAAAIVDLLYAYGVVADATAIVHEADDDSWRSSIDQFKRSLRKAHGHPLVCHRAEWLFANITSASPGGSGAPQPGELAAALVDEARQAPNQLAVVMTVDLKGHELPSALEAAIPYKIEIPTFSEREFLGIVRKIEQKTRREFEPDALKRFVEKLEDATRQPRGKVAYDEVEVNAGFLIEKVAREQRKTVTLDDVNQAGPIRKGS